MGKKHRNGETVVIKKYANRRLYDTSTSSYVTLDHLSDLVRQGVDFVVQDAKSGEDITRSVLGQIIFEQENKGDNVLPLGFLRQIIQFYGDNVQNILPAYLEMSMASFANNQERWRDAMSRTMVGNPMAMFEEQTRLNMEIFEKSLSMFSPPNMGGRRKNGHPAFDETNPAEQPKSAAAEAQSEEDDGTQPDQIAALQDQLAEVQRQLTALSRNGTRK